MSIKKASYGVMLATIILLVGLPSCSDPPVESPTLGPTIQDGPAPTIRTIPTLYPTATAAPTVAPTNTRPPEPTEPPSTPINFDQTVVDIRFSIPNISMDRRITGNVASKIEIIDGITGESIVIPDQPGILLELQQVLEHIELEEMPDNCIGCVSLEYELPLSDKIDAGWLQDVQLLASLENYTTVHLGPHFPPGTVLGLRQSATPYNVAHSIAFTIDNQLWRWTATDTEIRAEPSEILIDLLNDIPEQEVLDLITRPDFVSCPMGPSVQTLFIDTGDEPFQHHFSCPELTLASSLIPTYSKLAGFATEASSDAGMPEPEPTIPLDSVVDFKQADGSRMTLYQDGLAIVNSAGGITQTVTLTSSLVVSTTIELIENSMLQSGTEGLLSVEEANILFVRGPFGVYSYSWMDSDHGDVDIIIDYLEILRARIGSLVPVPDSSPTEPAQTPTPSQETE